MADVVHHVDSGTGESNFSSGIIIGIGLFIIVIALLVIFGLPALRGGGGTAPAADTNNGGIPSQVDVNLNAPDSIPAPQ
jgi:hypothetical protein